MTLVRKKEPGQAWETEADTGGSDSTSLLFQQTELSSAQILALHDTPVEIVPAPGADKIALPIHILCIYHGGSAGYDTGGNDLSADPAPDTPDGSNSYSISSANAGMNGTNVERVFALGGEPTTYSGGFSIQPSSSIVDQAWNLYFNGANPTGGNGTITVYVSYLVYDV